MIDSHTTENLSITRAIKPYLSFLNGGTPFVGITYTGKETGEKAAYRLQIGVSYLTLVQKWKDDLSSRKLAGIELEAANALIASFNKTLAGTQDNNRRAGQYVNIAPGLKVNLNDGTCELFGVQRSRRVLVPGTYPVVNSRELTIAKDKLRNSLDKWRSFALDDGHMHSVRIMGDTLVFGEWENVDTFYVPAPTANTALLSNGIA